ncbi:hypothetical protein HGA88_04970 [Candidatus Roizmanbacteria bacterium]|nr:hypothetical protein [Candidatus Roizmanbacteria bacterium]
MKKQLNNLLQDLPYYYAMRESFSTVIIVVITVILALITLFFAQGYFARKDEVEKLASEVTTLQTNKQTVESNKKIAENDIDEYNAILTQLIPESEDFFSIILALEKVSEQTGFRIAGYGVNPSLTSQERVTISVNGDGDADTFIRFLKTYQFGGGRLMTNESYNYSPNSQGKINMSLHFYSKKTSPSSSLARISSSDWELLNKVKSKTQILMKSDSTAVTDYATKTNPF